MDVDQTLATKLAAVLPHLNERQRRVVLAAEVQALGRGEVARVARVAGVSRTTVHAALRAQAGPDEASGRIRQCGGGRKRRRDHDPALVAALEALVDPDTRGDPTSPLRWTCKSTRQLARALTAAGHPVSHTGVGDLLRSLDYSLQSQRENARGRAPSRS
jgi:hypothetical protein